MKLEILRNFKCLAVSTCLVLASTTPAFGEDKAEEKPEGWQKSLIFGFNLTDGNSESTLFTLGGSAEADFGDDIWLFSVAANHGETTDQDTNDEETVQDDVTALGSYKHLVSERTYLGFGADFLYDNVADVNYRLKLKPAVGYFLIKEEDLRFSAEVGPGYVFEEVGGVNNNYFAPFISERLEWDISETAKLFETATYTFDVDNSDNYLIEAQAGLEAALSTNLSLVVAITDVYDNVPAEDKVRNDIAIVTALKVAL